jgi:hypothetical protein
MVSPYNYSIDTSGIDPFGAFTQAYGQGQQIRANQMAMQKAQAEQQQKLMLQTAMVEFATAKTPLEKVAVIEKFPQLAEQATATWKAMDEITRKPVYEAGLGGYSLLSGGDTAGAVRTWRTAAEAFRAGNKPDMAKQFQQLADIAEKDPNTANTMASAFLAGADPERFKKFGDALNNQGLTGFQKDLAASGIDPASQEGRDLSRRYVQNRADPIVTMQTRDGKQFVGPMSVYQRQYGDGGPAPTKLPIVTSEAQYKALPPGTRYVWNGAVMEKP